MAQPPSPCSQPGHAGFDFWLGEWDLTWPADQMGGLPGQVGAGTNRVERVLEGCVVEENFTVSDGSFRGRSVSVFDPVAGLWRQTWVDSSGGYIALRGRLEEGRMVLSTDPVERDGQMVVNRMVFRDMTTDSLKWDWQGSRDGGETWVDLWNIDYRRADGP